MESKEDPADDTPKGKHYKAVLLVKDAADSRDLKRAGKYSEALTKMSGTTSTLSSAVSSLNKHVDSFVFKPLPSFAELCTSTPKSLAPLPSRITTASDTIKACGSTLRELETEIHDFASAELNSHSNKNIQRLNMADKLDESKTKLSETKAELDKWKQKYLWSQELSRDLYDRSVEFYVT